nr:MAG TPA: hypothetical protein [Caudoviricetes sp.]DAR19097.1 MAG TPA: hypothetical protein [Caudoviricetes sp.]DAS57938.1 MAG TPA: hypothetical protein [Caudoviricetes sp.]
MGAGKGNRSQLPRISRWLALFLLVNTAKHSGFYITVAPKAPGPKKRRLKWHLHANF